MKTVETSSPSRLAALIAFEQTTRVIPIAAILPLKVLRPDIKRTKKYQQVATSIEAVGLIELPVVIPSPNASNSYFLLDGLLRIEVLKDRGETQVECLIASDDEAYTYNKRISRLTSVQEHRMIVRAVERGVSIERIAKALNLDPETVRQRFRLLNGLCPEAVSLLEDKDCPMVIFNLLKRMRPLRQMEAAELIVGQNNYSSAFAKAILAITPKDQLVPSGKDKARVNNVTREQIARLERELEATQQRTRCTEESYGADNLTLTVTKTYLIKMLSKPRISQWLARQRPDFLAEFQTIAEFVPLRTPKIVGAQAKRT